MYTNSAMFYSLNLSSMSSFETGRAITYKGVSGGCAHYRYLWGNQTSWNQAQIIQTACSTITPP